MSSIADVELTNEISWERTIEVSLNSESFLAIASERVDDIVVVDSDGTKVIASCCSDQECSGECTTLAVHLSANGEVEFPSAITDWTSFNKAEVLYIDFADSIATTNVTISIAGLVFDSARIPEVNRSTSSD